MRIEQPLFGRIIPIGHLDLAAARIVDLSDTPELQPRWRTMGVGLPGRRFGWFRLNNGDKALVFLARSTRAAYLPTTEGYGVLVGIDPDVLLTALRAIPR